VTSRAFGVLSTFDSAHRVQRLTDLSRRSGLPVATTYRLVKELCACGALQRQASGAYVIGDRLWSLGQLSPTQAELSEVAGPFLSDICAATHATTKLAIRDGVHVVCVDRVSGHGAVPIPRNVGARLPMHASGLGKVLLAYAPLDVLDVAMADLKRFTPRTVTDPEVLAQQLDQVRASGYATTFHEMTPDTESVAVPLFDAHGEFRAAISVVTRHLGRDLQHYVSILRMGASGIGRRFL
jgi:DNA-binding IclR family transcriptional regulator